MGTDAASQPTFHHAAVAADSALGCLTEPVRRWFQAIFGTPTLAQRLAWPVIVQGEHLLLSTPTGSGKTLAAFLPLLGLLQSEPHVGLRGLYLSPLKALGRDVRKNLREHIRQIETLAPQAVPLRLSLRTGDTSRRVRQQQLLDPPHVLITTPESLAVLLSHASAAELFRNVRWVVVDEVHALACSKRGADLAVSLERLERLAQQPLQRIGLSATCAPLTEAARFLVGMDRPCRIAAVDAPAEMELNVEPLPFEGGPGFMARLVHRLSDELLANRTTLIFTNTRSLAERVTWALRKEYPDRAEAIGVHHSSLAPVRRRAVERQLKQGRLWVAISSASLELGIDISSVDQVVFVHPPDSVVRLLQQLGRSGHGPNRLRRGLVLTASSGALLEATVTASSSRHGQIEPLPLVHQPFDVLCQQLVGLAMAGSWSADDAFALVRRAAPYRDLERTDFDACLDYLSGRHSVPSARLRWEDDRFTIANDWTAKLLRRNLGTILGEEPCTIRLQISSEPAQDEPSRTALVGEVDEVYADRLEPGDRFMLDGRCLELRRREGRELLVEEVLGRPLVPRWHGTSVPMSVELARRLYLFRVQAGEALRDGQPALEQFLRQDGGLTEAAVVALSRYFVTQELTSQIPDLTTLLLEGLAQQGCVEYYVHTPLPCPANEVLARVVGRRLLHRGIRAIVLAADLGFLVVLERPTPLEPDRWRLLLDETGFAEEFNADLHESGLLRDRFAQVAQTGLLVLRQRFGRRHRTGRRRLGELFEQLRAVAPDFILLRQAEREVRARHCDLITARGFINQVPARPIQLRWLSQPSPFADQLLATHAGPLEPPATPADALDHLQQAMLQIQVG